MLPDNLKAFLEGKNGRIAGVEPALWPWLVGEVVEGLVKGGFKEVLGGLSEVEKRFGTGEGEVERRCVLVVPPAGVSEEGLAAEIRAVLGVESETHGRNDCRVMVYPAWDVMPYDRLAPSAAVVGQRMAVMAEMRLRAMDSMDDRPPVLVVVARPEALATKVYWPLDVNDMPLEVLALGVGTVLAPADMMRRLVALGYERAEVVQAVGQFAVRGGMVDVWCGGADLPHRLEWFDDQIERLRLFDPATQRVVGDYPKGSLLAVPPVVEAGMTEAGIARFREVYRARVDGVDGDDIYDAVSAGQPPVGGVQLAPLFAAQDGKGLLDCLPAGTRVIWGVIGGGHGVDAEGMVDAYGDAVRAVHAALGENGQPRRGVGVVRPDEMVVDAAAVRRFLATSTLLEVSDLGTPDLPWRGHLWWLPEGAGVAGNVHQAARKAAADVAAWARDGWVVVLTALTAPGLVQLNRALEGAFEGGGEGGAMPSFMPVESMVAAFGRGRGVYAVVGPFLRGWVDPLRKVAVVAEGDVFGRKVRPGRVRRKVDPDSLLAHFSELREGDFVVHESHGIGKFDRLVTLEVNVGEGATEARVQQDFLRLLYAGDDRLLVPVENLDVLTRYKGSEAGSATLDRLGTGGWEARKEKVKEDLMAMAGALLETAAARELVERPPYETIGHDYDAFCAGFDYALTDDQVQVMADVEADLAARVPMDRLVVGDVGFGKTEVALRAAFLVAQSGRQVAVVCPTTLLARQHIDVFGRRFAGTPYTVAGLSRLVKPAEAKKVKEGLARGNVDIVVGTHALLSKDVRFKDLGLMVVDEEQRFGVAHKEKLKQIAATTDVLTLTATPIPRTLQMAVGGVRQLSLITTPPVDRMAVQTHVARWDNPTLKGALVRELERGGQVYVVAPHVEDLGRLRDSIVSLVPQARVVMAHGQMGEAALEAAMVAFYEGSVDVLVATTIIESGLDVPRANTLVVYRADRFGLAQLYQLRGRVGRSNKKAYAYFILPDGPMSADAAKRLQILSRLEGLGAGFMLASYDMDLRGFGNLLGKQQSGHIREIGFELYARMLREAVEKAQKRNASAKVVDAERPPADAPHSDDVQLKLGVSYLIPAAYIADEAVRLQVYRRLARVKDAAELDAFEVELKERFGRYPDDVKRLLAVVGLKNRLKALNVSRLDVGEKGVVVALQGGVFVNPEGLMRLVVDYAGVVSVRPDMSMVWHRRLGQGEARLKGVETIVAELEQAAGLVDAAVSA